MTEENGVSSYPPRTIGPLDNLKAVRRELSRVYKDSRQGRIPTSDGTRLAFILTAIAKVIEQSDLERRVEALERGVAHHAQPE